MAKRKAGLVTDNVKGMTKLVEASRSYDMSPEIKEWVDEGRKWLERAEG